MASFDITSLFINVPLDETINLILDRLFHTDTHYHGFSREEYKKLVHFSVKDCHFIFNGSLYEQIDGVAMGSPLGPLFADIFLSSHEKSWLDNCPSNFKPSYYRRYVDDCFLLFRSPDHIPLFLNFLNRQHPNINFTFETESNRSLPFLDIDITRHNGTFTTSVYRKPTFTGLFTNFHSFIPFTYKQGLILSLLHRCFNICSSYENFHKELEMLKSIFKTNGFPTHSFDKCASLFLDKTFTSKPVHTVPKKVLYFSLPFTGCHSLQIRTQILKLCSSAYPHIRIRFVFQPGKRLAHLFNFKDRIPKALRSCVVYSYTCQCCSALYVGQTARHLHTRASDHLGVSALTGKKLLNPSPSSILTHLTETGHTASLNDFKILSSCSSASELLIRERLIISKLKPSLNANLSSVSLSPF